MTKTILPVQIRWIIRRDMPDVLAIESAAFDCPWTEEDFICCLRQRNCIGMLAIAHDKPVGFVIYELLKTEIHVLNFAVNPSLTGLGIGTQIVNMLKNKLRIGGRHTTKVIGNRDSITLEVRESNLPAQLFFRAMGFAATDVLRGYYEETEEDAYQMEYLLKGE